MFNSLQRQQLEAPGTPMRFGHCVSPSAAPPALIREFGIQGWPKVGSIATVTSLQRLDAGTIRVQYELSGRFQMLSLLAEEPIPVRSAPLLNLDLGSPPRAECVPDPPTLPSPSFTLLQTAMVMDYSDDNSLSPTDAQGLNALEQQGER